MENLANWNNLISLIVLVFTWTIKPCLTSLQKSIDKLTETLEKQGAKIEAVQVANAKIDESVKSAHRRIDNIEEALRKK